LSGSIKLKHASGNGVIISAPATNPTADRTITLPSTDADGVLTTKDSSNSLQAVSGVNGSAFSNRNLLINGAMLVWQRQVSTTTDGGYCADRFWAAGSGLTYARSTDAPAGFKYSAKLTFNNNTLSFGQPIELCTTGSSQPMVAGNTVTVSFYGKVDSGTEGISCDIRFRDSKFSSSNQVAFTTTDSNPTLTTSWQRFTKTFTIPAVGGTNVIAALELGGMDRTSYLTGFQLELGSESTDFEHRSFGDELGRSQRYYTHSYNYGTYAGANTTTGAIHVMAFSGAFIRIKTPNPCYMRTNPSVSIYSTDGTANKWRNQDTGSNINAGTTDIGQSGAGLMFLGNNEGSGQHASCQYVLNAEF